MTTRVKKNEKKSEETMFAGLKVQQSSSSKKLWHKVPDTIRKFSKAELNMIAMITCHPSDYSEGYYLRIDLKDGDHINCAVDMDINDFMDSGMILNPKSFMWYIIEHKESHKQKTVCVAAPL